MFTPMQHINANRHLKKLALLLTDGRYSGVSYGAAIGHITPEAGRGGGILYLQTGDLLQTNLRAREIAFIDKDALREAGTVRAFTGNLAAERQALGAERLQRIRQRRLQIVPTNRMDNVTDAARGVVPLGLAECATESVGPLLKLHLAQAGD